MSIYEHSCTYGSLYTQDTVFVVAVSGGWWYCVEGSQNANFTNDVEVTEPGVHVEDLSDLDHFTTNAPIESLEDLMSHLEDLDEL